MGRPKRYRRTRVPKVPVVGDKALPGRPRKDGLPPIQKKIHYTPEQLAQLKDRTLMARISLLAGRGLDPKLLAIKIRREYPETNAQPEDFEVGGRFHDEAMNGRADAVFEVGNAMYERACAANGKGVDPIFFLKCLGGWSETAAGRLKNKAADEDDVYTGIDVTVTD